MRIDAHQHFWSINRPNDYGFLVPDAGVLYNEYKPADLKPILDAIGIDYTILVQAAESEDETNWLLHLVEEVEYVAGVVGWIDFDTDSEVFKKKLDIFRQNRKFIGLRPMLQDLPDDRFILRSRVLENLNVVASLDLPFDILVYPKHLPHIYEMLKRVPGIRAVIDHMAKPEIRSGNIEPWLSWMRKISRFPNVWCKLSGMVTEADHHNWEQREFDPYIQGVVQAFGPKRLMFGSDWPVCLQAAAYAQVYDLVIKGLENLSEGLNDMQRKAIFGTNASIFYKLNV